MLSSSLVSWGKYLSKLIIVCYFFEKITWYLRLVVLGAFPNLNTVLTQVIWLSMSLPLPGQRGDLERVALEIRRSVFMAHFCHLLFACLYFLFLFSWIHCWYQEAEKEMDTLSRYKKQLQNTNNRLESELEETKKLLASREQVSEEANSLRTCTSNEKSSAISQGFKAMPKKKKKNDRSLFDRKGGVSLHSSHLSLKILFFTNQRPGFFWDEELANHSTHYMF